MIPQVCVGCGRQIRTETESEKVCKECERKYPPSLVKACTDHFDYALCLSTGHVVRFTHAQISGEYCTIHGDDIGLVLKYPCPRGVDIRVADIVWCADAPTGS